MTSEELKSLKPGDKVVCTYLDKGQYMECDVNPRVGDTYTVKRVLDWGVVMEELVCGVDHGHHLDIHRSYISKAKKKKRLRF